MFFYKRDRGFQQLERPFFLAVEDPQDVTNDLAKGSYAIQKVSIGPQLKSTSCRDHPVRGSHRPHFSSGGCVLCGLLGVQFSEAKRAVGWQGTHQAGSQETGIRSVSARLHCLQVRNAFDFAYQQLSAPAAPGEAILQRIIRLAGQHPQKRGLQIWARLTSSLLRLTVPK